MPTRVQAENLIWELLGAYDNKNSCQTKYMKEQFLELKSEMVDCIVERTLCETIEDADGCPEYMRLHADWSRLRKQERRIHRLIDKLTDILAITQDTTLGMECWQKIQNIEATAANAIAMDLNILEGDE